MSSLRHFGILGMKWGVRKDRDSAAMAKGKAIYRNKDILDSMTDEEIRAVTNRIQLETNLASLTGNKSTASSGKTMMGQMKDGLNQTINRAMKEGSWFLGKKIIDYAFAKQSPDAVKETKKVVEDIVKEAAKNETVRETMRTVIPEVMWDPDLDGSPLALIRRR